MICMKTKADLLDELDMLKSSIKYATNQVMEASNNTIKIKYSNMLESAEREIIYIESLLKTGKYS